MQAKGTLPAEVLDSQVDPAAFELSGHLVLKRAVDFDTITEDACWRLLECASLDEVRDSASFVQTACWLVDCWPFWPFLTRAPARGGKLGAAY